MPAIKCPCGSGKRYQDCCAPLITSGTTANSPEQLMRSRFSAYVLNEPDYLYQSWHPDTRPDRTELNDAAVSWEQLRVLDSNGDRVEFLAIGHAQDKSIVMHERSRFTQLDGKWVYVDGEIYEPTSRNGPCPCGSGKKFKRCCGRNI